MDDGVKRPAVFLDRDGTVVIERDYLSDPERAELVPNAAAALSRLTAAGFALIVATNQSGIGRGLYREADYCAVRQRIAELLEREGVHLDGVYHCPHHPDFTGPCACRKPGTLLFERAIAEHGLDPARSWFVGDRLKDVEPARTLGGRGILVRTGYGKEHEADAADFHVVDDIAAAADLILGADQG
jgi:D-glycero-D-manno-heptose 1,7-bisphosphate phosphatase